jgi:hypothetical protein
MSPKKQKRGQELKKDNEAPFDTNVLIACAETEDEVGCVLRLHFLLESLLNFYLERAISKEQWTYVNKWIGPRSPFAQKLAFAIAYKFPVAYASAFREVNTIRNALAHQSSSALSQDKVDQLGRMVNRAAEVNTNFVPLGKRYISIAKLHGDRKVGYRKEGPRMDFLIAGFVFCGEAASWVLNAVDASPSNSETASGHN